MYFTQRYKNLTPRQKNSFALINTFLRVSHNSELDRYVQRCDKTIVYNVVLIIILMKNLNCNFIKEKEH